VGAYGERQALNIGVSGAGNKPFYLRFESINDYRQVHDYIFT